MPAPNNSRPFALPDNWDPQAHLPARITEYGTYHESRAGARLAQQLVDNGHPDDLALAEQVLEAVLRCQERREGANHYGNFYWMAEDEAVEDLNAVEFVLHCLIPMMILHAERLSPAMRERVLESIRLGLDEIRRLDVLVAYSNICVLDIVNTCLGGELLGDADLAARGYGKLAAWVAFTDLSGTPWEYNSPTYTSVTIRALKHLADLVRHGETRVRARTIAARVGLTAALHIHAGTGRWAGPHSRAYHPTVVCETPAEIDLVRGWIAEGALPAWLCGVLESQGKMSVEETADAQRHYGLSTHHGHSFSLGVAASEFGGQSNVCLLHYHRPGAPRPGVLYTRYLVNDKWLGDSYHATDRTKSRNLIDEGEFRGVQDGPRAIGLYSPKPLAGCTSAKAALIWTECDRVDEVWVGGRRVTELPHDVSPGEVVVVASGDVLMAVRPLTVTDLHHDAPLRLAEVAGDLVLELYNYRGPSKSFWEMRWPGAFYQGRPQCGFYLEVAERAEHPSAAAFGDLVASGSFAEHTDPPHTYDGTRPRHWRIECARDGRAFGLEVDLMAWRIARRWRGEQTLGWPMLESPLARQMPGGAVTVGEATLRCDRGPAWLYGDPKLGVWVAGYHGAEPTALALELPDGRVTVDAFATGTIVWEQGRVHVEAVRADGLRVEGGALAG